MGQSIQEWTKWNLWKATFKKFTWSILEYFDPYTERKLNYYFNIKNPTKFEHQHDIVYLGKCPDPDCNDNYIDETARKISEWIVDYSGRDNKSYLLKLANEREHKNEERQDFRIVGKDLEIVPWSAKFHKYFFVLNWNLVWMYKQNQLS